MASLPRLGGDADTDPASIGVATAPPRADGTHLAAAALYGPPDRQPQAALEDKVLDGGRGRARDDLEETVATRFLAPQPLAFLA
jgi:hypothetical protein